MSTLTLKLFASHVCHRTLFLLVVIDVAGSLRSGNMALKPHSLAPDGRRQIVSIFETHKSIPVSVSAYRNEQLNYRQLDICNSHKASAYLIAKW